MQSFIIIQYNSCLIRGSHSELKEEAAIGVYLVTMRPRQGHWPRMAWHETVSRAAKNSTTSILVQSDPRCTPCCRTRQHIFVCPRNIFRVGQNYSYNIGNPVFLYTTSFSFYWTSQILSQSATMSSQFTTQPTALVYSRKKDTHVEMEMGCCSLFHYRVAAPNQVCFGSECFAYFMKK